MASTRGDHEGVGDASQSSQDEQTATTRSSLPTTASTDRPDSHGDVPGPLNLSRARTSSLSVPGALSHEGLISPDAADRVFPIRSVVSVEPTPAAHRGSEQAEGYFSQPTLPSLTRRVSPTQTNEPVDPSQFQSLEQAVKSFTPSGQPRARDLGSQGRASTDRDAESSRKGSDSVGHTHILHNLGATGRGFQIRSDEGSQKSDEGHNSAWAVPSSERPPSATGRSSVRSGRSAQDVEAGAHITARFTHVVTDGGHAVITGRDGETLQRCEDEPIHIPGAVQSFGALVAFHEEAEGKLAVKVVSEHSKRVIGYTPKQLFALESFTDILSEEQTDNLLDHIDFVRDEATDVESNGPEVFTISIRNPQRRTHKLWCAIHINSRNPDLVICEFELEDDPDFPLVPAYEEDYVSPEDTLSSEPTEEELRESTEAHSRPLRVLRGARRRKGEAAALEVFNIMSQVQEQLAQAANLDQFLKILVGVVKELTGFHRVMIYQFDQAFNGKVVTELVDPRATKDLYKGLHFPASDIPKQARDLYRINKVRLLYDRDQDTSRLVCKTIEDLETPLDLTHSYLRAMSPIHIKYLKNMAVRSSMSISINAFKELWGLISCHTYGVKGTRVSFPIRKMCRLIGDSASRNIERLSYASRLQARKLINTAPTTKNPSGYIIASSDDLLTLFDADYGLLSIHDETKILGKLEATQEALALLEYLRMRSFTSVMISHDVHVDFPDLRYPPGFKVIAGLLLVPLTVGGGDFIVFFRKGQLKEVRWAGNPYQKFIREGTEGYLEPRTSFKAWTESVVGKCREWTEDQSETAAVLCLVYGKFIEVWRQKEAALQNTQLTKLLLQNSAHEVRTPLNAIINYLEIALEGSLDAETRDNLARSHSASKSLIYVINDLLDLTKTEASTQLVNEEAFDLRSMFREAVEMFAGDARRKQITFDVSEGADLPDAVLGDQRRVRQAISNVTANAIEATSKGGVTVNITVAARYETSIDIEVVVEDTGVGMNAQKLDDLFAELEQAQAESMSAFEDNLSDPKALPSGEGKSSSRILGLGLAVVARIIRNMDGQLRLTSEESKGSKFTILFPFELPASETRPSLKKRNSDTSTSSGTEVPRGDNTKGGELTLVAKPTPRSIRQSSERGSPVGASPAVSRANSVGSAGSGRSKKSLASLNSGRSIASMQSGKSDVDRLIEAIQEPQVLEKSAASESVSSPKSGHDRSHSGRSSHKPRSKSTEVTARAPPHLRISRPASYGEQEITDTKVPMRAVRIPDESAGFDELASPLTSPRPPMSADNLKVLIAEDDPINLKIIEKRLQKGGHQTYLTVNGEECASRFGEHCEFYDVILMDMQMPIVDGMTSTKMIRSFEKSHPERKPSSRAVANGRVPIFAVSASLVESNRQMYLDAGFDGWILKPISFRRLNELMMGIVDPAKRSENVYRPGHWEQGGWFLEAQPEAYDAFTSPSGRMPFSAPSPEPQQSLAEADSESSTIVE